MQFWPDGTTKYLGAAAQGEGLNDRKRILLGIPGVSNKLIRRELFSAHNLLFPEKSYYEDLALHLAVPALSQRAVYINKGYYHYRQHEQSKTATYDLKRSLEVMSALDYALQFYPLREVEELWEEFEFKAVRHGFMTPSIRALRANRGWQAVEVVKRLKAYINRNFPGWKSNRYLRGQLTMKQKALLFVLSSWLF